MDNFTWNADRAKGWQKELVKIKIKNAIDSTKNATKKQIFDSLKLAKKAIKHLK